MVFSQQILTASEDMEDLRTVVVREACAVPHMNMEEVEPSAWVEAEGIMVAELEGIMVVEVEVEGITVVVEGKGQEVEAAQASRSGLSV